ncbi:MAG: hypothetical protein QM811_13525 [Pirellulales bacterium]
MIRANVGLSRKLSKDYNSTGFTINLDGEISAAVSDAQAVIEQIKELYDLAEEAIDLQIERHQSDSAIASRDQAVDRPAPAKSSVPAVNGHDSNGHAPVKRGTSTNGRAANVAPSDRQSAQQPAANGQPTPATDKQIQFLLTISKRQRWTTNKLEEEIAAVLERPVGLYDLTKSEAGTVISRLTNDEPRSASRRA